MHAAWNRLVFALASGFLLCVGCAHKPGVHTISKYGVFYAPGVSVVPGGTGTSIRMQKDSAARTVKGELIEVREDGFLILSDDTAELTLVPYLHMARMRFATKTGVKQNASVYRGLGISIPPLQDDMERKRVLALFSRYPFGLDDTQLRRLLEALGQSELVVIGS